MTLAGVRRSAQAWLGAGLLERDARDPLAGLAGDHALGDGRVAVPPLAAAVQALGVLADDQQVDRPAVRQQRGAGRRLAYRSNCLRRARIGLR